MQFEWWELRIILVGVLIAISCSLLSVYIVLRRMAMISEGVSHAGFGGMGIALLLGLFLPAMASDGIEQAVTGVFCLVTALGIGYITKNRHVSHDSAIGIFLVAAMALGMIFIAFYRALGGNSPKTNLESLLFGQFAAVNDLDLIMAGAGVLVISTLVGLFYNEMLYTTLDEDMARVNGVKVKWINALLLILISLVIVVGVRMVGFLMITAMTIIPGATASMLSRRFGGVMLLSLAIGVLTSVGGLFLIVKSPWNLSPGPVLVLLMFTVFIVVWIIRHNARPKLGND